MDKSRIPWFEQFNGLQLGGGKGIWLYNPITVLLLIYMHIQTGIDYSSLHYMLHVNQ